MCAERKSAGVRGRKCGSKREGESATARYSVQGRESMGSSERGSVMRENVCE